MSTVLRFKGLLASLLVSLPLSFIVWFFLDSAHETSDTLYTQLLPIIVWLVVSARAIYRPVGFVKFARVLSNVVGVFDT